MQSGILGSFLRRTRRVAHALIYHLSVKHTISRFDVTSLFGFTLCVQPGVFHPKLFKTTKAFGRFLSTQALSGKRVLEMGCGSGLLSLIAARQGGKVTAVDVNPAAVSCTRFNALLNGLECEIDCAESDLFRKVSDRSGFDLIMWSPPFYPRNPSDMAERAWYSGEGYSVIRDFANSVRQFLNTGGFVYLLLSTEVDEGTIKGIFSSAQFEFEPAYSERGLFENITIYRFYSKPSNT